MLLRVGSPVFVHEATVPLAAAIRRCQVKAIPWECHVAVDDLVPGRRIVLKLGVEAFRTYAEALRSAESRRRVELKRLLDLEFELENLPARRRLVSCSGCL